MSKDQFEKKFDALQAQIDAIPAEPAATTQEAFFDQMVAGPTAGEKQAKALRARQYALKARRARSYARELGIKWSNPFKY